MLRRADGCISLHSAREITRGGAKRTRAFLRATKISGDVQIVTVTFTAPLPTPLIVPRAPLLVETDAHIGVGGNYRWADILQPMGEEDSQEACEARPSGSPRWVPIPVSDYRQRPPGPPEQGKRDGRWEVLVVGWFTHHLPCPSGACLLPCAHQPVPAASLHLPHLQPICLPPHPHPPTLHMLCLEHGFSTPTPHFCHYWGIVCTFHHCTQVPHTTAAHPTPPQPLGCGQHIPIQSLNYGGCPGLATGACVYLF